MDEQVRAGVRRSAEGLLYADGEALVRFKKDKAATLPIKRWVLRDDGLAIVAINSGQLDAELGRLKAVPEVELAEANWIVQGTLTPNDPDYPNQWWLKSTDAGVGVGDLNAEGAWDLSTGTPATGPAPVLFMLDTGVNSTHPDLAGALAVNAGEIASNLVDDDGNGIIDDVNGINTITDTGDATDDNGHGTAAAGVAVATGNNGVHGAGVAWGAKVFACKFLDVTNNGTIENAIECLRHATTLKAQGMNLAAVVLPWSGGAYSQPFRDELVALGRAGVLVIANAGNSSSDLDASPVYPASYPEPNLLVVGSSGRMDQRSGFSGFGARSVHLLAPGEGILAPGLGTSMALQDGSTIAVAIAGGAAALAKAHNPSLDWRALRNLLTSSGTPVTNSGTLSGRRLSLHAGDGTGLLTCNNQPVRAAIGPAAVTVAVGNSVLVQALSIDCAAPAASLTLDVSTGGTLPMFDDGSHGDAVAGDGLFAGLFFGSATGTHTISFPGGATAMTVTVLAGGYAATPDTTPLFAFTGTNLSLGDDTVMAVTSPFPINIGGNLTTTLRVSMNGIIAATASPSYINMALPTPTLAGVLVAPYWEDLFPGPTAADNVYWGVVGTAPARTFVVEWRNVHNRVTRTGTDTMRFQAAFPENSSDIYFLYADVSVGNAGLNSGGSATVGIQLSTASATQYSFNQAVIAPGVLKFSLPSGAPSSVTVSQVSAMPLQLLEGQSTTVSWAFSDTSSAAPDGGYRVELDLNWTGGFSVDRLLSVLPSPDAGSNAVGPFTQDGVQTVAVRVSAEATATQPSVILVQVTDVVPTVTLSSDAGASTEGQQTTVDVLLTDPGSDGPYTLEWDWSPSGTFRREGLQAVAAAGPTAITTAIADDGQIALAVRARDRFGVVGPSSSITLTVANAPPVLGPTPATITVYEGAPFTLQLNAVDPAGANDPLSFQLRNAPPGMTINALGGIYWAPALAQGDVAPGRPYDLTLVVRDDAGAEVTRALRVVYVLNDGDQDGMADTWEVQNGLNPNLNDAASDADGDGRTALDEYRGAFNPSAGPGAVALVSPVQGADATAADPVLSFTADAGSSVQVELYADVAITGQTPLLTATVTAGTPQLVVDDTQDDTGAPSDNAANPADVNLADDTFYRWRARATSGAAFGPWTVTERFRFNPLNDAPTAPTVSSPANGSQVSRNPVLAVGNSTDADSETLTYLFQVFDNQALTGTPVASATVPEHASGQTSFALTTSLNENVRYFWRATASDGEGGTTPSVTSSFLVTQQNEAPGTPIALEPLAGATVQTSTATLRVENVIDPEGEPVQYEFQIAASASFADAAVSGLLAEGQGGSTSFTTAQLNEEQQYFWRCRATDGKAYSEWVTRTFKVNAVNGVPTSPVPVTPAAGSLVISSPVLTVLNAKDPEGDALTYDFDLREGSADGAIIEGATAVPEGKDGATSFTTVTVLKPGTTYFWTARAVDAAGGKSPDSAPASFSTPAEASGCGCTTGGAELLVPALALALGLGRRRRR